MTQTTLGRLSEVSQVCNKKLENYPHKPPQNTPYHERYRTAFPKSGSPSLGDYKSISI